MDTVSREKLEDFVSNMDLMDKILEGTANSRSDALVTVYEDTMTHYKEQRPQSSERDADVFAKFIVSEVNKKI